MKKSFIYIVAAAVAASCVYPFDPEINAEAEKDLVIDGSIVVGGTSTVNLSYVENLGRTTDAIVKPKGKAWVEDSQGGKFYPNSSVVTDKLSIDTQGLQPGLQYRAGVEVDGNTYYSNWVESDARPDIKSISFTADDTMVYVTANVAVPASRSGYVGFRFEECWEFHTDFYPEFTIDPNSWSISPLMFPWPYYWCYKYDQSKQSVLWDYSSLGEEESYSFLIHSFRRSDSRNHRKYSIKVNAYALSRDAYLFNKRTQEMSELGGDLFSPDPGMLTGNVFCENDPDKRAYGYVMACESTSKRAFLQSIYLQELYISDAFLIGLEPDQYPAYYYDLNYRPVKNVQAEDGSFIGWGPSRCINCIDAGGTLVEPDFWDEKTSPLLD